MRYKIGQVWVCDRSEKNRPSIRFTIIGPGKRPGYKLCKVESFGCNLSKGDVPFEGEYSHKHLKKYAVLIK